MKRAAPWLPKLALVFAVAASALTAFLMLMRVTVHFPFYDEAMHVHYQWLVSQGLKPSIDFFCAYPALVYFWLAPVVRLLPDTVFSFFFLRLISFAGIMALGYLLALNSKRLSGGWIIGLMPFLLLCATSNIGPFYAEFSVDRFSALAAFGAVLFLFAKPDSFTVFAASALSLLSLLITPKFALPLFFALLGHLAAYWLETRKLKELLAMVALGGCSTLAFTWLTYAASGASLYENMRNSLYLSSKVSVNRGEYYLAWSALKYLVGRPLLGIYLLLGVVGWAKHFSASKDAAALAGGGMAFGALLLSFSLSSSYEQHQSALFLSLFALAPFIPCLLKGKTAKAALVLVLSLATLVNVAAQYGPTAEEFNMTAIYGRDAADPGLSGPPAPLALAEQEELLRMIPPDEPVLALWPYHPMFRRDLTPMSGDDRPSYSSFMERSDPLLAMCSTAMLKKRLMAHPPALIDFARGMENYPPGWVEVIIAFLDANSHLYVEMKSLYEDGVTIFIRKDLLPSRK